MLESNSLFEPLECSKTSCYCLELSLDHSQDSQNQKPLLEHLTTPSLTNLATQPATKPGDAARKKPSPDLAG